MSDRIIYTADLNRIEGALRALENDVYSVSDQVQDVNAQVKNTKNSLERLIQEFHDYVRKDQLVKNVHLAETRIVKVRQELETNFGHYGEVRRRVTGILQAVDVSLVKKGTIENVSEEHMLSAPRYWLAPCLIALSSWLNDKQELAEKAMIEAIRRDAKKTSLFFALVTRRGARYKASRAWLEKYLGLQDPHSLEREIVILIDGFANGIFGPDARAKCVKEIEKWIEELEQKVGFVEEQYDQWKRALESKLPREYNKNYPYLQKYSPTWPQLENSLAGAKLHRIIYDYFQDIFAKEVTPAKNIAYAVDALLDTLVSKFDEEELPLRRDERELALIIQENGDKKRAKQLFDNEKTLEERVSFAQLLTNFAMHPEESSASVATQKLSIALSKEWIKSAHDDITAENRMKVPIDIALSIGNWEGSTQDGSDEKSLLQSLENQLNSERDYAISGIKLTFMHWLALIAGALCVLMGFSNIFLLIVGVIGIAYFFNGRNGVQKQKDKVYEEYAKSVQVNSDILRATLAELVDWRKEYKEEDKNADSIEAFLSGISPAQYTYSKHDTARAVVQKRGN